MNLCQQSDVSAFQYTVSVCHCFSSKEQVSFSFKAAITIRSDFGAQENKVCHCFHCFLIYLPWSDGTRCHDLNFLTVSFKPAFSLSSFTFIKRLFTSYLLSAIKVISSAYLRWLIYLPANLIPDFASSSPAFCMMYSKYKLTKSRVTIYSLDVPLSWFGTSLLFHVRF